MCLLNPFRWNARNPKTASFRTKLNVPGKIMIPLKVSLFEEVPNPSWVERAGVYVPLIGWIASDLLWKNRHKPLRSKIEEILKERGCNQFSYNPGSEEERIARILCQVAKEECDWEHPNFGPDDDVLIMWWSYFDGLDAECAAIQTEETLKIDPSKVHWESLCQGTVGELVESLRQLLHLT